MPPVMRNEAMQFWQYCREYLALKTDLANVSELAAIEERQDPHTLSMPAFYLRLLKSLTNRQGMPNSIGDIERIRGVLCKLLSEKSRRLPMAKIGNSFFA